MIWLIGGTSDALKIADLLLAENRMVLVSTTTSYGSELAKRSNIEIIQVKLNAKEMCDIISEYSIDTVIDASHPFAKEVSENAIEACKHKRTIYIRFERKSIEFKKATYYTSYSQIVKSLALTTGNILLTIGSKNILQFKTLESTRLIARVLPVKESIELCETLGLLAHQIIAMKGRMSMATNKALMLEYNIKHLITKESGEAGGLNEKIDAAIEQGIKVHVLKRPNLSYPLLFDNYEAIIQNI